MDDRYNYADRLLYCVCGHSEDEHFNDGSDYTAKVGCEAGNNDGSSCSCEDFTLPNEPDEIPFDETGIGYHEEDFTEPEKPIRIQRRRSRGFDLQAESIKRNGLDCVYVGRPTRWGNSYLPGAIIIDRDEPLTAHEAVELYRRRVEEMRAKYPEYQKRLDELRGKNLACWCTEDAECHADVLLEMANDLKNQ